MRHHFSSPLTPTMGHYSSPPTDTNDGALFHPPLTPMMGHYSTPH
ncbi:unnamed protein product [Staurois parvus]|uniref:Uncharacterized protein n=1 Tax=Staurois parvus TaxID=386267 RepID=A0ABN9DAL7_9NEOB|nr:unnamed protein product [Staurois parvus]